MIVPHIWGQGQLFAFSAIDGVSSYSDDFAGILCGDRIGIRFFTKVKRELCIAGPMARGLEFYAVTGDYISFGYPKHEKMRIIYAAPHLIIGNVADGAVPTVSVEDRCSRLNIDGAEVIDTGDGDFTALRESNGRFAFAYDHSTDRVLELVKAGLELNLSSAENSKLSFYKKYTSAAGSACGALYAKCLSVMKTQLYSPEAEYRTVWSTPDRLPHRKLWLWDSVFHALGHRHISVNRAMELIRAIFVHQDESGFIPHMAAVGLASSITQPPVIAWGSLEVYRYCLDELSKHTYSERTLEAHKKSATVFLSEIYAKNARFLEWCHANRRLNKDLFLYTWNTGSDVNCRCDESGMDNSPRFDVHDRLYAIDFSCFMANDFKYMKLIAEELGLKEDAERYSALYSAVRADINRLLFSEEDGFYYDYNIAAGKHHKVRSVASFLPLFAEICDASQAEKLVDCLNDPLDFGTPLGIPSISRSDATFGTDMWRGPVWLNFNYMICKGLRLYGYNDDADRITAQTVSAADYWYQKTGTVFEFYDCMNVSLPGHLNRKGAPFEPYSPDVKPQTIRDYGWSCTLLADMICEMNNL